MRLTFWMTWPAFVLWALKTLSVMRWEKLSSLLFPDSNVLVHSAGLDICILQASISNETWQALEDGLSRQEQSATFHVMKKYWPCLSCDDDELLECLTLCQSVDRNSLIGGATNWPNSLKISTTGNMIVLLLIMDIGSVQNWHRLPSNEVAYIIL